MNGTADLNLLFTFGGAAVAGLTALAGSAIGIKKSVAFRRKGYWWLLACAFVSCLLGPFVYMSMTSYRVPLADAFLLRSIHAGAWRVAEPYSIFLGLALGGVVGFCLTEVSRSSKAFD